MHDPIPAHFRWLLRLLLLGAAAQLLAACPARDGAQQTTGAGARDTTAPAAAIPADDPLCAYDKLKLGMGEFALAQAYNAPEGQGDGFTRVLQRFDAVSIHTITFDAVKGQPARMLLLEFYRDQLCRIVDRRDGLTQAQVDAWRAECIKRYGEPPRETVGGAQWAWGSERGVQLSFTQDNSSELAMAANVVLVHQPTLSAAQTYLAQWEAKHPLAPPEDDGAGKGEAAASGEQGANGPK